MKTKIGLVMEDFIIDSIKHNRKCYDEKENYVLETCPFGYKCYTCRQLFPKWEHSHLKCPCGYYGKGYVKRRMKLLFPELY